jgi:hypothetical protein
MTELIFFLGGLAVVAVAAAIYVNKTDRDKPPDKIHPHSHSHH